MRYVFIFCLAFCWHECLAQFSRTNFKYTDKVINSIAFARQNDSLDSNKIRRIPLDVGNEFPFYVALGSENGKFINYEFFRIDTTRYFVREYFNGDFLSGQSLKSFGEEIVNKNVSDTAMSELFDPVCGDKTRWYLVAEHRLTREGEWTEFENKTLTPTFWRGSYLNNKKTGVWSRKLSFDQDTVLIGKVDYQKDLKKIYGDNGIREKTLSDLKELLQGRWSGMSFYPDSDGIIRSFKDAGRNDYFSKLQCYLDACQYQFNKSGRFDEQLPEGYENAGKVFNGGTWHLRRDGDQTFIDLIYDDGKKWEMELLYYGEKEGLFMNLNKHPQPSK